MNIPSFKEWLRYIQESPQINSFYTKDRMEEVSDHLRDRHFKAKFDGKTSSIGKDLHYYHDGEAHNYFHNHEGKPKELSRVDNDNVQKIVSKGNGSSSHILNFMKHHIKTHGELKTDSGQSPGAVHLWTHFIKSKPKGVKFEVHGPNGSYDIDHNNIDRHKDKIWNKDVKSADIRVRAYAANKSKKQDT